MTCGNFAKPANSLAEPTAVITPFGHHTPPRTRQLLPRSPTDSRGFGTKILPSPRSTSRRHVDSHFHRNSASTLNPHRPRRGERPRCRDVVHAARQHPPCLLLVSNPVPLYCIRQETHSSLCSAPGSSMTYISSCHTHLLTNPNCRLLPPKDDVVDPCPSCRFLSQLKTSAQPPER